MNNKPNNSGDGELMALLFSGAAAAWGGYQLSTHFAPDSWVNMILGKLAHLAGQQPSPRMDAIMAAALAFTVGIGTALFVADYFHRGKRKRAVMKLAREADAVEQAQEEMAAKKSRMVKLDRESLKAVAATYTQPEQPGQATFGFIIACAVGFGVLTLIAVHFL